MFVRCLKTSSSSFLSPKNHQFLLFLCTLMFVSKSEDFIDNSGSIKHQSDSTKFAKKIPVISFFSQNCSVQAPFCTEQSNSTFRFLNFGLISVFCHSTVASNILLKSCGTRLLVYFACHQLIFFSMKILSCLIRLSYVLLLSVSLVEKLLIWPLAPNFQWYETSLFSTFFRFPNLFFVFAVLQTGRRFYSDFESRWSLIFAVILELNKIWHFENDY